MERVKTVWEVWSYDVWGNAKEGYYVNNRFCDHREYVINAKIDIANKGTPQEFKYAEPSDHAIRQALGIKKWIHVDTEGDDVTIYVISSRDGYPLGELICVSHASLSPIKIK